MANEGLREELIKMVLDTPMPDGLTVTQAEAEALVDEAMAVEEG